MRKIILFDPSYATSNMGDHIIEEAVIEQMSYLFEGSQLSRYSTHTPLMHLHQLLKTNYISKACIEAEYKFLGGSNIFKRNLLKWTLDWNINIFTKKLYKEVISIGGGTDNGPSKPNWYTRYVYKSTLSKNYTHSVRDSTTKKYLNSLGFKAINTGCPTIWKLTESHCKLIPIKKARDVIFTLTEYRADRVSDQLLINTLRSSYDKVYFWIQGSEDLDYLKTFKDHESIIMVNPSLDAYRKVLQKGDIDYIGTRLHAGIYAMQHKVRSIIVIVDNRAREMQESFNINAIERNELPGLKKKIMLDFKTNIKVKTNLINEWKTQFSISKSHE